jgi:hypothetical protein
MRCCPGTSGQSRAVIGVDNATVGDTEFVEPDLSRFQITSTSTGERQVIQTNTTFVERRDVGGVRKLMKPDQGLTSDKPDRSTKWSVRGFRPRTASRRRVVRTTGHCGRDH